MILLYDGKDRIDIDEWERVQWEDEDPDLLAEDGELQQRHDRIVENVVQEEVNVEGKDVLPYIEVVWITFQFQLLQAILLDYFSSQS